MPATDTFAGHAESLDAPARRFAAVTKSDTVDFATLPRSLFVGTGGDVVAVGLDGVAVTFKNVAAGAWLPIRAVRVNATNTTAADIVAVW